MLQHRDLTFRNMLIQERNVSSSGTQARSESVHSKSATPLEQDFPFALTIIDFGASRYYGEEIHRSDAGNQGFNDLHAFCDAFYVHVYGRYYTAGAPTEEYAMSIGKPIPRAHQSLQRVLMICTQHNSDKTRVLTKQAVVEIELLASGVSQP